MSAVRNLHAGRLPADDRNVPYSRSNSRFNALDVHYSGASHFTVFGESVEYYSTNTIQTMRVGNGKLGVCKQPSNRREHVLQTVRIVSDVAEHFVRQSTRRPSE